MQIACINLENGSAASARECAAKGFDRRQSPPTAMG